MFHEIGKTYWWSSFDSFFTFMHGLNYILGIIAHSVKRNYFKYFYKLTYQNHDITEQIMKKCL